MADLKNDIERYRKGELSSAERHSLEKKALSDSFLAEALEGAESIDAEDFSSDVAELKQRLESQNKTKVGWTPLRMAASILLLLASGYILYTFLKSPEPVTLAKLEPKPKSDSSKEKKAPSSAYKSPKQKSTQDLLSLNKQVPSSTAQPVRRKSLSPASIPAGPPAAEPERAQPALAETSAESKVADKASEERTKDELDDKKAEREVQAIPLKKNEGASAGKGYAFHVTDARHKSLASPAQIIEGKVTSADDHSAIPGVNIVIKGTETGTVTDMNGNYQITSDSPIQSLVFSFIGYTPREVQVRDSSKINVPLSPDVTALSEVVVTGYGLANEDHTPETPTIQLAEPAGGKKAFKNYLHDRLIYPQEAIDRKVEGKVVIEFTIQSSGSLSDFTVVRGIGAGCDEEVIRLIKEGPRWSPNKKDDTPRDSKVRVRLKFTLPK